MIKQIQLRGISRTPSDRATADGGLAESLNVHLSENELAPTLPPEDATAGLGLPANGTKSYIYIHKGNGYTNYITLEGVEIGAYVDGEYNVIDYMENGEKLQSVSGIGNTIVVMGDRHPYYAIFKEGSYIRLGNKIPLPTIKITPEPVDKDFTENKAILYGGGITPDSGISHFVPMDVSLTLDEWNNRASKAEGEGKRFAGVEGLPDPEPGEEEEPDIMTWMRAFAEQAYTEAKNEGVFIHQVMVMYGVHLYNDAYFTSVPYLMPGGFESPFYCRYLRSAKGSGSSFTVNTEYIQFGAKYPYRIKAQLLDFDIDTLELWSDIIMSIDFFITPIIPFDLTKEKVMYAIREFKASVDEANEKFCYLDLRPCSAKYSREYLNRLLSNGSGSFRRVVSLSTDGMAFESRERIAKLREGDILELADFISDQDLLLTQPALADFSYDMRNAERTGETVTAMNNRLLLTGITETIPSGSQVFPAAPCVLVRGEEPTLVPFIAQSYRQDVTPLGSVDSQMRVAMALSEENSDYSPLGKATSDFSFPQATKYIQLVYHIQGRKNFVVRGRIGPQDSFVDRLDGNIGYFGFLIFPDSRCKSVDIYLSYTGSTWYRKTYEMREHPGFNASYMYAGADKNILWDVGFVDMVYGNAKPHYFDNTFGQPTADVSLIEENRIEQRDDVLLLSDVDNPWYFPIENEYQMQATKIYGTALATKALSPGQIGQFPLYVFTDNGIFFMQMTDYGTFAFARALSQEVAKAGTILPLDQAVAFVTDKGLMLLTGSDIQNLSPYMNGDHYAVEKDAGSLIRTSEWGGLLGAISDDSNFMAFMRSAHLAYDYAGERIICFNEGESYMYVYMLRTATWHKMSMPENTRFLRLLNSYPDTYLSVRSLQYGGTVSYARILNFSTHLEVTSKQVCKGVIATRPLDLGEPDIRKTIRSIRIRGRYNRNDVKYILLGSMDGINWGVLPSLRGGSYKLYRLVILTSLTPTERLSWIDIDYESRFANKLR